MMDNDVRFYTTIYSYLSDWNIYTNHIGYNVHSDHDVCSVHLLLACKWNIDWSMYNFNYKWNN